MAESLFFYKLVSPYYDEQGRPIDQTLNCKLQIGQIDSNFLTLKDYDISAVTFVRGEDKVNKSDGTLVITRNGKNAEKIIVPIDVSLNKNLAYDLNTDVCEGKSGATLTIMYNDDEGEHVTTLENVITADNLVDVIGHDILTKVISDNSLKGLGTMSSPLGIAGIEKTGMLAPAIKVLDLTDGSKLPKYAKKGTRYVTKENVSDYGYLYNGAGVNKIQEMLDGIYTSDEIYKEVEDRKYFWRVPSKEDWDKMLNSIEPCEYRNHTSSQCHVELGKLAGKFLKSECGCMGGEYPQQECTCMTTTHGDGCTYGNNNTQGDSVDNDDYIFDNTDVTPQDKFINPSGIDKYGMSILPSGVSLFKNGTPRPSGFGEMSVFWTTTHIYNDPSQDIYLKVFECDKSGVYQLAECPSPYYSVRLVKDYDGSNYSETEYIDGVLYKCVLFAESGQIWLASNFANTNGFVGYNEVTSEYSIPDYLIPNNGEGISDKRIEMFINEFNGRYWEKKVLDEGMTIVIQDPCLDTDYSNFDYEWTDDEGEKHDISVEISGNTVTYTWIDSEGVTQIFTINIDFNNQQNIEYRVYIDEDTCEKYLKNVDDLIVERVLNIIIPIIDKERNDREKADGTLSGAIEDVKDELSALTEVVETISGNVEDLREDLEEEISARTEADDVLSGAIDTLREDLDEEIIRAISTEEEISGLTIDTTSGYTISLSTAEDSDSLILKSKDGIEDHFIKIKFDGNFGEI